MSADSGPPVVPRRRLILLLGSAAGYLDAVGYLTLGLFTANMTGNTVLLGIAAGQSHWPAALRVALAVCWGWRRPSCSPRWPHGCCLCGGRMG